MANVEIEVAGTLPDGFTADTVRDLVTRTLAHVGADLDRIEVSFVSADQIAVPNRELRGKDGPTDVLSFPFDPSFPHGSGGEILVAPEVARRNAGDDGLPAELRLLVVHGALHLAGYEDETEPGRDEMDRLAEEILGEAVHG